MCRIIRGFLAPTLAGLVVASSTFAAFDDSGWTIKYQENFDSPYTAMNNQTFGTNGWLTYRLINGGAMTVANGYVHLNAPDYWNAGLIRSTESLPAEYKVRTKVGYINYDLANYDAADYADSNFDHHRGLYENGMYFLTITNDTCTGSECAENWWHYHRKMVIDVDNHLNETGPETFHPVFMVYMAPQTNSGGNLLRTWTGSAWDSSAWNWNVAYTYQYNSWYYAELEKKDGFITLRLYDGNKYLLEETTPVSFDKIFAITDPTEYLFVGEPHTDDYEGDVRIDEISLLVPSSQCCVGVRGNVDGSADDFLDISDLIYLVEYSFVGGPAPTCAIEADVNADGISDIGDVVYLVEYMFGNPAGPAPLACP